MARAHREPAVAEPGQHLADRAFVQGDAEPPREFVAQIHPPPAHHAVTIRIGPGLDPGGEFRGLLGRQLRLRTGRLPIVQSAQAFGVVAVNPISQRLTVHPARLRRRLALRPLQHQRDRQHPTRRRTVPFPAGRPAQLARRQILPRNHYHRTHRCASFSWKHHRVRLYPPWESPKSSQTSGPLVSYIP